MSKKKLIIIISSLVVITTITMTILFSSYLRANYILFRLSINNSNPQYYQRIEPISLESKQIPGSFYIKDQFRISIPVEYKKVGSSKIGKKNSSCFFVSKDKKISLLFADDYDSKQHLSFIISETKIKTSTVSNKFENDYEFMREALRSIPEDISLFDSSEKIKLVMIELVTKNMMLRVKNNIEIFETDQSDFIISEKENIFISEIYNKKHTKCVNMLCRNLKKYEILEIIKTIRFD